MRLTPDTGLLLPLGDAADANVADMSALTDLADEYYAYTLTSGPIGLMWNGKVESLAEWDDFSPEAAAERRAKNLGFAERAAAIEVHTDADLALRETLRHAALSSVKDDVWGAELFHVNPKMGAWEMVISFIDNFPLRTAEHGEDYLTKLRTLPDAFAQLAAVATASADSGIVALSRHLVATAESVEAYLATPTGADDRFRSQAAPTEVSDEERAAWVAERNRLVDEVVRPGIAAYARALRALAERGMPDDKPGLVHLPGGLDVYRDKVWAHLLLDKTPEELHQLGIDQVARLEDEYREVAGPLLGTQDISEIYARLRDDKSMKYTHAEVLIADAELALKKADAALEMAFGTLPVSECLATATPFGAMAYYSSPDPEQNKPGRFYFNTSHPEAWSTYELEAIVFHEGVPGHHMQLAINAENMNLHKLQREIFNTAFAEGWGLYAERLSDEMGLYSSELTRVGMLSADSLRACRLVVDTGMHAMGWTRDQAIQYMIDHTPMDSAHIEQEVDRYIGLPGQALAYMVGRLEIQSIRAEAEQREGFDLRAFHDAVLEHGAVPLSTLRQLILG